MMLIGFKRGFINLVFSLLALVLSLGVAVFVAPIATDIIMTETELQEKIGCEIENYISEEWAKEDLNSLDLAQQKNRIDELPFPKLMLDVIEKANVKINYDVMHIDKFTEMIGLTVAKMIISSLCYFVIFAVVYIFLIVVFNMLELFTRFAGLKQFNRLAGCVLALVEGLVFLWLICIIITACANINLFKEALAQIEKVPVLSFIYNNNILVSYLMKIVG